MNKMVEVFTQWDGEGIEYIANQIFTNPVKYIGDSFFETEEAKET